MTAPQGRGAHPAQAVTQLVRPAGAGHETAAVLAGCALILAVAGTVVSLRATPDHAHGVPAHQVDARRDLTAAEQGIYADLRVALEEIMAERTPQGALPTVGALAGMGLPPFAQDASSVQRGAHVWLLVADGRTQAYLGQSADGAVAGSLLLRVKPPASLQADAGAGPGAEAAPHRHGGAHADAHEEGDEDAPDVWLHRTPRALPAALDDAGLTRAGWKQIAARFDAGVTRQRR